MSTKTTPKRPKKASFSATIDMASEARSACNHFTREQREAGVNRAMSLIYGSASDAHAVSTGRR